MQKCLEHLKRGCTNMHGDQKVSFLKDIDPEKYNGCLWREWTRCGARRFFVDYEKCKIEAVKVCQRLWMKHNMEGPPTHYEPSN